MIDLLIGLVAAILILAGIAIIAGSALPRALRAAWALLRHLGDRFEPAVVAPAPPSIPSGLTASSQRALQAAAQLMVLLREHGHGDLGAQLRAAARRLPSDEPHALRALSRIVQRLQRVRLEDDDANHRLMILRQELKVMVADRAEQLELLPFR